MKFKIIFSIACITTSFSIMPSSTSDESASHRRPTSARATVLIRQRSNAAVKKQNQPEKFKLPTYLVSFKEYIDELNDHEIAAELRQNKNLINDNIQIAVFSGMCAYTQMLLNEYKSIKNQILNKEYDLETESTLLHLIIDIAQYHKQKMIDFQNKEQKKKFHHDKYKKMATLLQILINNGADINAMDHNGMTPLHKACQYYDLLLADVLLDQYAYTFICDNKNKTAEEYLLEYQHPNPNYLKEKDHYDIVFKLKNPPVKKVSLYAYVMKKLFGESTKIAPSTYDTY